MRSWLLAALYATAALAYDAAELRKLASTTAVPGGYIVELASSPKRALEVHDDFLGELDKRATGKFTTRKKFSSSLFNGIAVQLHTPEDLVSLSTIPNVIAVRPIVVHPAPKTIDHHIASGPSDPAVFPDGESTHFMTGVDKAHAQGIAGKGIQIAVIDTGIDYTHPSLGGAFGPGHKVAGGLDLVGDDYYGSNTPVPDDDPFDACIGHGTHVAGIIGADPGNDFNISGVAYEASLFAYRVFGCLGGGVGDDVLTDAMIRAFNDGADVITLSIGGADGWSTTTTAVVASRIADQGRVVTIAAGNDGEAGALFTSSPATGKDVISVSSVQNIVTTRQSIVTSVPHDPLPYDIASYPNTPGQPLVVPETPFPVYSLTSDPSDNRVACDPLGDDVPDLSSYAVVLRASTDCNPIDQYDNVFKKNASLVILYNIQPFLLFGFFQTVTLLNDDDGVFLVNEFAKGSNISVTFPQHTGSVGVPNADGGLVSYFSSFGPSNEVLFKPAVSAPGGNITSTWPVAGGSWAVDSGTSMATPFMAGAAALVLQTKGRAAAKNVRTILQTTANPIPVSKAPDALPQTLAQQGAGLVNVFNAVNVQTQVSPGELLLNDTAHWNGIHAITLKNTGKTAQTYVLSHQPAGTTVTIPAGDDNIAVYPVPLISAPVSVHLSQTHLTLAPGRSTVVLATITPPRNVDPKTLPIVSGWITVLGSRGDSVRVAYLGIAGALRAAQAVSTGNGILVGDDGGLPAVIPLDDGGLRAQRGLRNYTLDDPAFPVFVFSLAQGSRRVTIDLVPADTALKSTIPDPLTPATAHAKRAWSWWWPGIFAPAPGSTYAAVPTLGLAAEFDYLPRGGLSSQAGPPFVAINFPTVFANGTAVPLGEYRVLLRALRLTGNPADERDYDVYVSQPVGIVA